MLNNTVYQKGKEMAEVKSKWLDALAWLREIDRLLPQEWPPELPPESTTGFWKQAAEMEMQHRTTVSQLTQQMIEDGRLPATMTALDLWFYRRRVEWASQLILAKAQEGVEPDASLTDVLKWVLIKSWDTDGCIGFWNHAVERQGKPHPLNPYGYSPIEVKNVSGPATPPSFQTQEVSKFYDSIRQWSHPEYPFLDAQYAPGSYAPAVDMTPFVTDCLMNGQYGAIGELWSFLTCRTEASLHLLQKAIKSKVPDWLCLSSTAKHELKAINLLCLRAAFTSNQEVGHIGAIMAATVIGSRQLAFLPAYKEQMLRLTESETSKETVVGSLYGVAEGAKIALETAMSPLAAAEPCTDKLKSISPMARLVVADYVTRGWGQGLRFCLYYGERMYGCGVQHNQMYVDWLDFFAPPDDNTDPPAAVTKDVLRSGLEQHGLVSKKTASRKEMICMARTLGDPLTVPAGNVALSTSSGECSPESSPVTLETMCMT